MSLHGLLKRTDSHVYIHSTHMHPHPPPHRHWSGSFKLKEEEDYFGLRIRHANGEYKIIPVNITVGAAGSVLVTLKSEK